MLYDATGNPIPRTMFPNGEFNMSHVPFYPDGLVLKWESDEDLFHLMMVKRHLHNKHVSLRILYMPYGRMDRDSRGGSQCSLRFVAEFIKDLGFEHIYVCDPHSELTLAYLGENASSYYPFRSFNEAPFGGLEEGEEVVVMFPDAGAQKRYGSMEMYKPYPQIAGFKKRDFETGKITGYDISNAECIRGKTVVIVDDLCSYGGTFVAASEELRKFDPKQIVLVVSHCERSIFDGKLFGVPMTPDNPNWASVPEDFRYNKIDHLVTTNSILTQAYVDKLPSEISNRVHILPLIQEG